MRSLARTLARTSLTRVAVPPPARRAPRTATTAVGLAPSPAPAAPGHRIMAKNLAPSMSVKYVREYFGQFGRILDLKFSFSIQVRGACWAGMTTVAVR